MNSFLFETKKSKECCSRRGRAAIAARESGQTGERARRGEAPSGRDDTRVGRQIGAIGLVDERDQGARPGEKSTDAKRGRTRGQENRAHESTSLESDQAGECCPRRLGPK